MELKSDRDVERIMRWSACLHSPNKYVVKNAAKKDIISVLQQTDDAPRVICCRRSYTQMIANDKTQTILAVVNGHASDGETAGLRFFTYWPSDCFTDRDVIPSNGVTSTELYNLLSPSIHKPPMMVITDFSYCFNFLNLPFVLVIDGDTKVRWANSGKILARPESQAEEEIIVHFAGTEAECQAHEFASTGGIFTR
ncbi:hypothetical protein FRC07_009731, partial [Ceratobasidium sp. 392]